MDEWTLINEINHMKINKIYVLAFLCYELNLNMYFIITQWNNCFRIIAFRNRNIP